ncbi:molybdenum-dependent transcriptional regulator [Paramagnetospirillum kuznetsovii]|uniref:Molybdenum-dependent transcriptional regulator n=1 Tax=Paramagnetospirillum kuznetsovii TaxID=2053833 RepID=A0A364NVA9_9PROT|nr:TOBE domain-containing protein [Paramagnetospirillum kuznetsovii]RAU21019.1 molybdenum-dependent transcriptional regulator [Paramagnetospirillum kuznetsovii]
MADCKVEAILALRGGSRSPVGRDRIALLEAVATQGSITKAAQAVGLSYKAAWDALNAVNNLLPRPAVAAQTGGRNGGGAVVTEDGKALIEAFHLLEERLSRVAALFSAGDAPIDPILLLRSLGMKTSARNAFRCTVTEIHQGSVNAEVILHLTDAVTLAATITDESLRDLAIVPGLAVTALVKASFVMLAIGEAVPSVSARNRILGTVAHREDGPVSCEITLDIGGGKVLTAVITRDGADELGLRVGARAWALIKASQVILAVD